MIHEKKLRKTESRKRELLPQNPALPHHKRRPVATKENAKGLRLPPVLITHHGALRGKAHIKSRRRFKTIKGGLDGGKKVMLYYKPNRGRSGGDLLKERW